VTRALVLACLFATSAAAQTRTGVSPREATVGDRITSVAELPVPAGSRLEVRFPAGDTMRVQSVGAVRVDTVGNLTRATATLVAWTPGAATTVTAEARIVAADGTARPLRLRFPVPAIRSVLPADTTKHKPRPPKDVFGPDRRVAWRLVAAGVAVALALLALLLWLRRRRRRPRPIVAPADARAQALQALEAARAAGVYDGRAFYTLVSGALRGFAHAVRPRWSPDLTTSELERRMEKDGVAAPELDPMRSILRTADLAKFGRVPVPADTALRDLEDARAWVERFGREAPR
jgi:hypothetical protein